MSVSAPHRLLMTADAVGGVWTYCMHLCAQLSREGDGIAIDLATMGPAPDPRQRAAAAQIPRLTLHVSPFKLEWMTEATADVARAGDWLLRLAAELAPDVIHLNGYAHGALPFGVPKLVVAHSCVLSWWRAVHGCAAPPEWRPYAAAVRRGLDGADHVVAPSGAMGRALVDCYGFLSPVSIIPNGLPPVPQPRRKQSFILAAGRLWDAAKNLDALVAVAPELPWPTFIAGEVAFEHRGEGSAAAASFTTVKGVTYLGRLDETEMAATCGRAAIFAHPARYEPFGLSVLEAAARGCALVLGDIESLRENWDGAALFVDPEDRLALAAALRQLTADEALRTALGDRARRRSRQFSIRTSAEAYRSLYAALIAERRGVRRAEEGATPCVS